MLNISRLRDQFNSLYILGLGVTGQALVRLFQDNHLAFYVWDDNAETRTKAEQDGLSLRNPVEAQQGDLVVQSPGLKPQHPILTALHQNNITVWNDLDVLYYAAPDARYIGITGSNGKSTTTALVGHILRENKIPVAVGGNIGLAAATLPTLDDKGVYVIELSSYQLHSAKIFRCDVALCLNISEDHLDWHGTMEAYIKAKNLIFCPREQRVQHALVGLDTSHAHYLFDTLKQSHHHRVTGITQHASAPEDHLVAVIDGTLYEQQSAMGALSDHAALKGVHNIENRLAAFAVCRAIGLSANHILQATDSFNGLKHRQQPIGQIGAIYFINDSKATNSDAAAKALATFDDIYWIVGGQDKTDGIDGLDVYYPKVRKAYLIGVATDRFAAQLEGHIPYMRSGTIAQAVRDAFQDASLSKEKSIILLSPSCASFDQYRNFESRGDDFIAQVHALMAEQNTTGTP
jgi:UDP-N-acetylmuramoylalanine--D-glutamate ligase